MTEWVVEGLVPKGDSVLVLGHPHAGKSWVLNQLAYAAASGRSLFFTDALSTTRSSVILIDEDSPTELLVNRCRRIATSFGLEWTDVDIRSNVNWRLDRNTGILIDEIRQKQPPVLVIIESLSHIMPGTWDPNRTSDAISAINQMNKIKQVATLVTSHHLSVKKPYTFGDPYFDRLAMGNTQFNAGCDTIIGVAELDSNPTTFGIQPVSKRTLLSCGPLAVQLVEDQTKEWGFLKLIEEIPHPIPQDVFWTASIFYRDGRKSYTIDSFEKDTESLLDKKRTREVFNILLSLGFIQRDSHRFSLNINIKSKLIPQSLDVERLSDYCEQEERRKSPEK